MGLNAPPPARHSVRLARRRYESPKTNAASASSPAGLLALAEGPQDTGRTHRLECQVALAADPRQCGFVSRPPSVPACLRPKLPVPAEKAKHVSEGARRQEKTRPAEFIQVTHLTSLLSS